ncbi:hypothetical protein PoMZ_11537 [Pyricularia oryzae]|uniref:Uncharacterized protein n=1 Tax=Pyricularia oryzae TaxID=318829 RepID=A0A4P7NKM5_PYROR|nr:hypothetical protein PoMZ_11537 [Pyricularia oryzae]
MIPRGDHLINEKQRNKGLPGWNIEVITMIRKGLRVKQSITKFADGINRMRNST